MSFDSYGNIKFNCKSFWSCWKNESALVLYIIISLLSTIWVNTLANRIRDFGGNPWYSLWSLVPIVNPVIAFYYGIVQYKNDNIKPTVNNYIDQYDTDEDSTSNNIANIDEDEIYEKVMFEIEEDKKVKSTWAKALSQSDGNKDKAEATYINLRVSQLIDDVNQKYKQKHISLEKNKEQKEYKKLLKEEEERVFNNKLVSKKENNEISHALLIAIVMISVFSILISYVGILYIVPLFVIPMIFWALFKVYDINKHLFNKN